MGTNTVNIDETLKEIYYNLDNSASFSTLDKLYIAAGGKISKPRIKEWLSAQLAYTIHKPRRLHFKRGYYNIFNINDCWQADLMDLTSLAPENDNVKYILIVIDSFSRFVRVRPLKSKSSAEVLKAFKSIISEAGVIPLQLLNDRGTEFVNKSMRSYLKSKNIKPLLPSDDTFKCAIVERANRTFKNILFKYLTSTLKFRYLDILQDVANTMNKRVNRSINMAPADVNENNVYKVWKFVRDKHKSVKKCQKSDIEVGSYVRVSKNKYTPMDKGFLPNWSDQVFKVVKHTLRNPQIYELENLLGEKIEGIWYKPELQIVKYDENTIYRIDKILGKRKRNGITEVCVKWKGYDDPRFNSWLPETQILG
jgi:ribosomal protein S6